MYQTAGGCSRKTHLHFTAAPGHPLGRQWLELRGAQMAGAPAAWLPTHATWRLADLSGLVILLSTTQSP